MPKKYKSAVSVLLAMVVAASLAACSNMTRSMTGDKNVLERTFKLDADAYTLDVGGLEFVSGGVEKLVVADDSLEDSLKILTDDNIFSSLEITIDREMKTIKIRGAERSNYDPSVFTITVGTALSRVSVNGEFSVTAALREAKEAEMVFAGKADCTLVIDRLTGLSVNASGNASVKAEGTVGRLMLEGSGAANIDAGTLVSSLADVKLSGASTASVTATEELYAEAEGSSVIKYGGGAEVKRQSATGLAELIKID